MMRFGRQLLLLNLLLCSCSSRVVCEKIVYSFSRAMISLSFPHRPFFLFLATPLKYCGAP